MESTQQNKLLIFLFCLFVCLGGGWLTGLITKQGIISWYPTLVKPVGTPPDITFPIVWTILYFFMAIALTCLWISPIQEKTKAFVMFFVQLCLNFVWSTLFFYVQNPGLALIDILLLWASILVTIVYFYQHTKWGMTLLIPYLLWVTYAVYLNLFIWILN